MDAAKLDAPKVRVKPAEAKRCVLVVMIGALALAAGVLLGRPAGLATLAAYGAIPTVVGALLLAVAGGSLWSVAKERGRYTLLLAAFGLFVLSCTGLLASATMAEMVEQSSLVQLIGPRAGAVVLAGLSVAGFDSAKIEHLDSKPPRTTFAAALLLASLLGVGAALRLIGW